MNNKEWINSNVDKNIKNNQISSLPKPIEYKSNLQWNYENINNFKILCLTWNLGGTKGPENFDNILDKTEFKQADIICLSTQESCNSILKSFIYNSKKILIEKYKKSLGNEYEIIFESSMNAIHICLFMNLKHKKENIKHINSIQIKRGFKGLLSNKGAIGVQFDFYKIKFLFVNLHIASGNKNIKKRQNDLKEILKEIFYSDKFKSQNTIFIMGDFNFRIQKSYKEIIKEKPTLKELLKSDELPYHRENTLFPFFNENEINFPPSYKYMFLDNLFDFRKKCPPSWCDRILYFSNLSNLKCTKYEMLFNQKFSDHKPIIGYFEILEQKKDKIDEKINKNNDIIKEKNMDFDENNNNKIFNKKSITKVKSNEKNNNFS